MLNILLLLALIQLSPYQEEQGGTGIFLTLDCRKNLPRKPDMLTAKNVCLTESPIITPKDFASVGPVKEVGLDIFFDLTFTPKAHQTLIKLVANLPDSKLALVVNDEVFFVFKAADLKVAPTFRFQTITQHRNQVETVHGQLVEIIK